MPNKEEEKIIKKTPIPLGLVFSWIIFGAIIFHNLEGWSWPSSFYYAIVTLTTVGYGDLTPTTDFSRGVAAIYILIGVTIVLGSIGYMGNNYLKYREENWETKQKKKANHREQK